MRAARTAAVLLGIALAAPVAEPAIAHAGDRSLRAAADAKKKKRKPRPVVCKAGQLRVTLGTRVRCRSLTAAAGRRSPQEALLLAVAQRSRALRAKGGRRIAPFWSIGGGRLKAVRSRLTRALPKALALASPARISVRGDPTACADLAGVRPQTSSFDGFSVSVGATGSVSMSVSIPSGYRIEIVVDSRPTCSNLDLPACPDPDGALRGTDGHRSLLSMRVTKDGVLLQSVRTTVRSTQKLRGTVADDAKLDTVALEDTARESTTVALPGATVTVGLSVLRTAELDMRGGGTRNATVRVGVGGFSAADAARTADDYARTFPDLIAEERGNFQRRESLWQAPGACAKLALDPASGARRVRKGEDGSLAAKIEANAGGLAAKARWTTSAQENGTFAPPASPAASQTIAYRVTGEAGRKLRVRLRATSTAGVDEREWVQDIEDLVRYFKVTGLEYTDQLALDGLPAVGGCTPSTSQTNSTTLIASGAAYDGAIGPLGPGQALQGSLTARGTVLKNAAFSGCKLNDDATAWVSCPILSGASAETAVAIDIDVPAAGSARAALPSVGLQIGDVPPVISPCVTFGTQVAHLQTTTISPPAETFASAGPHTLAFDVPADVPAPGGGTLHSAAHYAITFVRVNADGSPYSG